jgi:sec-independent protein translocase protein TatA
MGGLSPIHWIIVIGVAAVLFGGRGKLSGIMGDAAKGIRAFKDGLKDDEHAPAATTPPTQIAAAPPPPPAAAPTAAPMAGREDVRS